MKVLSELKNKSNPKALKGMSRFGVNVDTALGVSIPLLRQMAKSIGKNHSLALQLWDSNCHEARMLASMIDEPAKTSEEQLEKWVNDFNSWDICDQVCSNLIGYTVFAYDKAFEWSKREEEFVKRAGFVMMAVLSVKDKKANDEKFREFFPVIIREATDTRNFVRKAVNWALRQIGKRNLTLNKDAIEVAKEIQLIDNKAAKWIAADAIRELTSKTVQERLVKKLL